MIRIAQDLRSKGSQKDLQFSTKEEPSITSEEIGKLLVKQVASIDYHHVKIMIMQNILATIASVLAAGFKACIGQRSMDLILIRQTQQ